jgi:SAM-dependent methyltransferase
LDDKTMESVVCDFCGESNAVEVTRQTDILHRVTDEVFTIVCCTGCGLNYLNPRPTRAEIGRYYADEYRFHAEPSRFHLCAADLLDTVANSRLAWIFSWVPRINFKLSARVKPRIPDPVIGLIAKRPRLRVLDIGCGSGVAAHFWGHRGSLRHYRRYAEVCGMEIDDQARDALQAAGIRAYRDIEEIPAAERFDIIRMNWSLEHVHSPTAYFRFVADHLANKGKAIITVPNYDGLLYRIAKDCVELPIHLYHFRRQDVINYTGKYGLTVLEYCSFSYPQMYVVAAQACATLKPAFADAIGLSDAIRLQRLLARVDSLGFGNDMMFVLEKAA